MATMLGYEGSVLLVAVLLLLALGLAGALYAAVRDDSRRHVDHLTAPDARSLRQ